MKENQVHLVGMGKPKLADDEAFVAAIRDACEAQDCRFQRFVSAMGPYGTWLVEIERDGADQRVLWNGKTEQLVLQVKLVEGGWDDPVAMAVESRDRDGFVAGVEAILSQKPGEAPGKS